MLFYEYETMKLFLIVLLIFESFILNGQNFSVLYELRVKDNKGSAKTLIYSLDILKNESVFRSSYQKTSDSLLTKKGYGYGYSTNIDEQIYIQKNIKTKEIRKVIVSPIMRDRIFIKIPDSLKWNIFAENRKIGSLNCKKIETEYGGRHWTGWFTEDIPILDGPYVFNGLPGLIIQINDTEQIFDFQVINIINNKEENLYIPKKGKKVSLEIFNKIRQDYYNDPFSYVKLIGAKAMEDDGSGGMKKIDIREKTEMIRETIRNIIPIELNQKIEYK